MQANDSTETFQRIVLEQLDTLTTKVDGIKVEVDELRIEVDGIKTEVDGLKQELSLTNVRVDTYQKASTQVVNLAFGLIAIATVTIIITAIVK
jgi:predicted  nucleic acid-binding Zn-ribbon protein